MSRAAAMLLLLLICCVLAPPLAASEPADDKRALLDFIRGVRRGRRELNWKESTPVCDNWTGVTCSPDGSRVVALRLPGVGFNGRIPVNTLSRLSALQVLSLRSNGLSGPFPPDFPKLTALTGLHLHLNSFSGELPDFSPWKNLTVVDLSFNSFNGSIPSSISNLTQLTALDLSNNSLSNEIPDLELPGLTFLNLSNNRLSGNIPKSLQRFNDSSFAGNNLSTISTGFPSPPLPAPGALPPASTMPSKTRKFNISVILGIIVGGAVAVFAAIGILLILCFSKKKDDDGIVVSGKIGKGDRSPEKAVKKNIEDNNRLVFLEGCSYAFDLEDLLRASAEVLGKGTLGTAYKAVLEDATTVVVKRLKEVGVGRKEFEQQMEIVGRLQNENIVELRAFYYSKDEKLVVYDYYPRRSVHSLLHGTKREFLDWESRIKIAIGAARGITYIHSYSNGKLVHGNIKSSNLFLNNENYACVSDVGLSPIMTTVLPLSRTAGYRAPEVVDTRKVSQASDVYSFGVLLLELLTGRSPIQITGNGDQVIHLVRWVQSVVREEWTAEVFDVELLRYPGIEEEMVEMLQIAMSCVVKMPEQRPKMADTLRKIEDVRRINTGNRPSTEASDSNAATPPQAGISSPQ